MHVLDWNTLAAPPTATWLYGDDIHLRPGGGREGYADWLAASIQP